MDPYPRPCVFVGTGKNQGHIILPCFLRMWCCIRVQWQKEKDCMADMEWLQWSLSYVCKTQPGSTWNWGVWSTSSREICCSDVWPVKCHNCSRWSKVGTLCSEAEVIWVYPANTKCIDGTCRTCLGTVNRPSAGASVSFQVGMVERWKQMENSPDFPGLYF